MLTAEAKIIAPQAPLEESATTEASRRCSLKEEVHSIRNKGFGLIFSKFSQLYRALLLRVLRIERRATAKNEALDEFC